MPLIRFDAFLVTLLGSAASAALVSHGVFAEHPSSVLRRWTPREVAKDEDARSVFLPTSVARYSKAIVRLALPTSFVVVQFDDHYEAGVNAFVVSKDRNADCVLEACLWAPEEIRRVKSIVELVDFLQASLGMRVQASADLDVDDFEDWVWATVKKGWDI